MQEPSNQEAAPEKLPARLCLFSDLASPNAVQHRMQPAARTHRKTLAIALIVTGVLATSFAVQMLRHPDKGIPYLGQTGTHTISTEWRSPGGESFIAKAKVNPDSPPWLASLSLIISTALLSSGLLILLRRYSMRLLIVVVVICGASGSIPMIMQGPLPPALEMKVSLVTAPSDGEAAQIKAASQPHPLFVAMPPGFRQLAHLDESAITGSETLVAGKEVIFHIAYSGDLTSRQRTALSEFLMDHLQTLFGDKLSGGSSGTSGSDWDNWKNGADSLEAHIGRQE